MGPGMVGRRLLKFRAAAEKIRGGKEFKKSSKLKQNIHYYKTQVIFTYQIQNQIRTQNVSQVRIYAASLLVLKRRKLFISIITHCGQSSNHLKLTEAMEWSNVHARLKKRLKKRESSQMVTEKVAYKPEVGSQ